MSTNLYVETAPRLDYNPETGEFLWKYDPHMSSQWNTRFAEKRAGSKVDKGRKICIKREGVTYILMTRRLAWLITYGYLPEVVTPADGDQYNDAISNLRASTYAEGSKKSKISLRNKTGVIGVSYNKRDGKYQALVMCKGSTRGNSKYFDSLDKAESWVKLKQLELGFDPDLYGRL